MNIKKDILAGLSASLVAVPFAIGGGITAVSYLGPEYVSLGVKAGLICAVVAALVTAIFGSSKYSIAGPSATTSIVLAAALAQFAGQGVSASTILLVMAIVVAMAGLFLVLAGLLRWGSLIKFIPRPVTSGFVNGIAILLFLSQVKPALGISGTVTLIDYPSLAKAGALLVTVATLVTCIYAPRLKLPLPPSYLGLVAGVALHNLIERAGGEVLLGPLLGNLPSLWGQPQWFGQAINTGSLLSLPWGSLLAAALLLGLMAAIQTLMTAVSLDSMTHDRHDSNRELIGYGLGNIASSLSGGIASSAALGRAMAAYRGGGTSRVVGASNAISMLLIVALVSSWLSAIPLAVMAGILIHSATVIVDAWGVSQIKKWLRGKGRGEVTENAIVVVVMVMGMLWMNPAIAVGVGVVLTMLLFLRRMSRTFVRNVYSCEHIRSRKIRPEGAERYLQVAGSAMHVVELDGAMFFGTADRLRSYIEAHHANAKILILDCRRVRDWDATGVQILGQMYHLLNKRGQRLMLSHVSGRSYLENALRDYGLNDVIPEENRFVDTDRALEKGEEFLLAKMAHGDQAENKAGAVFGETVLFRGLNRSETDELLAYFETLEFPQAGVVFRMGEVGDRMFVLVEGEITIGLRIDGQSELHRLSTITPGIVFGEMALIDEMPRSAEAICQTPVVLKSLSKDAFERMRSAAPHLFAMLLKNIAYEVSVRLRLTNQQVRALEN